MWIFVQNTGKMIKPDGSVLATGYSGNGEWTNDPTAQGIHDHGPIPCGHYTIGMAEHLLHLGQCAMKLTPNILNNMFGRSDFFIHGDNASINHTGSDGCIVLDFPARLAISASPDRDLQVIPTSLDEA